MKLRFRPNSVRLRLGKSDVERLQGGGRCQEVIRFPGGGLLEYVLEPAADVTIGASFSQSVLRIAVPESELVEWCRSKQVGLAADLDAGDGLRLHVLIEKDFRCLDADVSEDQSDTFENPLAEHTKCAT